MSYWILFGCSINNILCTHKYLLLLIAPLNQQEDPGPGYYHYELQKAKCESQGDHAFNSSAERFDKAKIMERNEVTQEK